MSKRTFGAIAGLAAAGLLLAACGGSGGDAASSSAAPASSSAAPESSSAEPAPAPVAAKVGVILPDAASSARWETADRPFLEQAFAITAAAEGLSRLTNMRTLMPEASI